MKEQLLAMRQTTRLKNFGRPRAHSARSSIRQGGAWGLKQPRYWNRSQTTIFASLRSSSLLPRWLVCPHRRSPACRTRARSVRETLRPGSQPQVAPPEPIARSLPALLCEVLTAVLFVVPSASSNPPTISAGAANAATFGIRSGRQESVPHATSSGKKLCVRTVAKCLNIGLGMCPNHNVVE